MMTYRNNLSPSDTELSTKLRDTGDATAFETLYTRHATLISSFLFRLAGDRGPALLPKLIDRLRDRSYAIRDVENFHLWALGVTASFWREETKEDELPKESDPQAFQVIHRLAYYLRPVFVLVHYFQLPLDDVASALRISRGTATSRLQDAFASLVAQIAPADPPPPIEEALSVEVVSVEVAKEEKPAEVAPETKPEAPIQVEVATEAKPEAEAKPAIEAKPEAPGEVKSAAEAKPPTPPPLPSLPPLPKTPVLNALSELTKEPAAPPVKPAPPAESPAPPPLPMAVSPLAPPPTTSSGSALAALIPKLSFDTPDPKEPEKKS